MDDALLVGVLHGLADPHEEFQPLPGIEPVLITVAGHGNALDQVHHKEGPPGFRGPGVQHPGDVRVVHQGQGLPFGLKSRQHLPGVPSRLNDLQGHEPPHGLLLLGLIDHPAPAFTDLLEQLIAANPVAGLLDHRRGMDNDRCTQDGDIFQEKAVRALLIRRGSEHLLQGAPGTDSAGGVRWQLTPATRAFP